MNNRVELKNIKTFLPGSEETICYTATLYIDGKRTADASNDGHGGCDLYRPFDAEARKRIDAIEAELATEKVSLGEGWGECSNSLELVVGNLLEQHLAAKQMKSAMSRNVLFLNDGAVYQIKATAKQRPAAIAHVEQKYPKAKVLNTMPTAEALKLFTANA